MAAPGRCARRGGRSAADPERGRRARTARCAARRPCAASSWTACPVARAAAAPRRSRCGTSTSPARRPAPACGCAPRRATARRARAACRPPAPGPRCARRRAHGPRPRSPRAPVPRAAGRRPVRPARRRPRRRRSFALLRWLARCAAVLAGRCAGCIRQSRSLPARTPQPCDGSDAWCTAHPGPRRPIRWQHGEPGKPVLTGLVLACALLPAGRVAVCRAGRARAGCGGAPDRRERHRAVLPVARIGNRLTRSGDRA